MNTLIDMGPIKAHERGDLHATFELLDDLLDRLAGGVPNGEESYWVSVSSDGHDILGRIEAAGTLERDNPADIDAACLRIASILQRCAPKYVRFGRCSASGKLGFWPDYGLISADRVRLAVVNWTPGLPRPDKWHYSFTANQGSLTMYDESGAEIWSYKEPS